MNTTTKRLTISALLVALGVILSRFLSIPISLFGTYSLNIGFGMLPVILLCVLYGPVYGALGAAAWDLLGALLFPKGAFVVWFTLAAGAFGLVTGAFFASPDSDKYLKRPASVMRTFIAVVCGQFIYSVGLNTLIIHTLYSVPVITLLIPRLIENVIMVFVNTFLVIVVLKALSAQYIITDKLPGDIKSAQDAAKKSAEPVIIDYSLHEKIGMIGGYICNNNAEKARELYEDVMCEYKREPSLFSVAEKKDLARYRAELSKLLQDDHIIVVTRAFDADAEIAAYERLVSAGAGDAANVKKEHILRYYSENATMFTDEQKQKLTQLGIIA